MICLLGSFFGCSSTEMDNPIIEENYSYYNKELKDSVLCLQIGKQFVDEKNVISMAALKHELVDETPAKVKVFGEFIQISSNTFSVLTNTDTVNGIFDFNIPNPKAFLNQKAIIQGVIQLKPTVNFKVNGVLVLGVQKKLPIK